MTAFIRVSCWMAFKIVSMLVEQRLFFEGIATSDSAFKRRASGIREQQGAIPSLGGQ
jgi:hypothetical protein